MSFIDRLTNNVNSDIQKSQCSTVAHIRQRSLRPPRKSKLVC